VTVPVKSEPAAAPEKETPFEFLRALARELSTGRVELPSFPDAAARTQQVLSDDSVTSERIARVVGSDAGLAGRILTMANSTLLHRGGAPVTDLKVAVARIGHDNIRTAALSYATAQLRRAPDLAHIRAQLETCWQDGVRVAALMHAMAKETRGMRSDEALLAGLLHNVGKIYIIARAPKQGAMQVNDPILRDWYPGIGTAVVENWKLPEAISQAVGGQLDTERSHEGEPADLQDLLIVAVCVAEQMATESADDSAIANLPATAALGLSDSALIRIMLETQTEMEMLQAALG
jgi:HD-like signal output (HDOD) protein